MTLNVPYEKLPETVKRLHMKEVYVTEKATGVEITAQFENGNLLISRSTSDVEAVKAALEEAHLTVFDGMWSMEPESDDLQLVRPDVPFVAAVSYNSDQPMPGVWVDSYVSLPTQMQVLKAMYEEFRATGELGDVAMEEFIRLANPNVVIISPNELLSYLVQKEDCPPAISERVNQFLQTKPEAKVS